MKTEYWGPALGFLMGSIPTMLLVNQFPGIAYDFRVLAAIGVGGLCATAVIHQLRLQRQRQLQSAKKVGS